MFSFTKNNKVKPINENVKIKLKDKDKCKCGSTYLIPLTDDRNSLYQCIECGEKILKFKYVIEENINKDTYNNFISKSDKIQNFTV